jgi:hypothetical protein
MTTLSKVFEKVDEFSKSCWDDYVPAKDIKFDSLEQTIIGKETHNLKPVAQMSMAFRLGIPLHYLKRCPTDVQAYNMNYWIQHEKNEKLFVRFDGDEIRAIFTPKYIPTDNFELLEKLNQMGYSPETNVQCHLDGEFMLLNIPDSTRTFKINKDKMTPGISIHNSEVGLASVGFAAYILRLICTNGLVVPVDIGTNKYRHVSSRVLDEFPEILNSLASGLSEQQDKIKFSMGSSVDNPLLTIEQFNRQFQLGKSEKEAVTWAWPMEQGNTMFNVVQAYTRAAQYEPLSAHSSYKLQQVGGNILSMLN